jgi:uncharacterized protein YggE
MMKADAMHWAVILVAILVIGAVAIAGMLLNQTSARLGAAGKTITVSATGSASGSAAQETLYLAVNGTGITARAATDNLSSTMGTVNTTLLAYVGGNTSMISTTSYSLTRSYNYTFKNGTWTSVPTGYLATESLKVTLPDVNDTGAALNALASVRNVYVSSVQASLSDEQIASLRAQALSSALSNATQQASIVAGGVGIYPMNISVSHYYVYPVYPMYAASGLAGIENGTEPTIYTGVSTVTESVSVVFGYK